ncbi:hypothetical protein QTI51_26650 [Variovorax sp. J22G73]|uniref:hypothetical protein n=1 Tax=unclassified Variovorax TaxID=663243 RepID=UPI002575A202|nr:MULTISPECIES: hypothetical protein [unclassified Variovorax]MDM0008380.1 hypothetical protein [Variovorax sp. J22R203]MDM0100887.1 hypothetical protein [Variovorax sp. J22G73]
MAIRNITLADEQFKTAFVDGKFVIDCIEIKLTQNGADAPATYSSPGYLLTGPEIGAECRLVCLRKEGETLDIFGSLKRVADLRSGRIIPDTYYYMLEACDVAGNTWTHPAASIVFQEHADSITLNVSCDYLRCSLPGPSGQTWTDMVVLEELEFPMNVVNEKRLFVRGKESSMMFETASAGTADTLSIIYDARKGSPAEPRFSELYAAGDATAPKAFEERLLEAVRFATATMFWPVITETVQDGARTLELSKARPAPGGKMINPPLNPRGSDRDFYALVSSYYKHACATATGNDVSPISAKLGGLYTLKSVWIDTVALVVSVAIESLVKGEKFKDLGSVDPELKRQMEIMKAAIDESTADKSFRGRGLGLIGRMGEVGIKEKLTALANCGALASTDPETWRKLRNSAAHGSLRIDPAKMQEMLDNVFKSVTMVYKLVFMEIGYAGKYTDFSQHGWPRESFNAEACWNATKPTPAAASQETPSPSPDGQG